MSINTDVSQCPPVMRRWTKVPTEQDTDDHFTPPTALRLWMDWLSTNAGLMYSVGAKGCLDNSGKTAWEFQGLVANYPERVTEDSADVA